MWRAVALGVYDQTLTVIGTATSIKGNDVGSGDPGGRTRHIPRHLLQLAPKTSLIFTSGNPCGTSGETSIPLHPTSENRCSQRFDQPSRFKSSASRSLPEC
jgi:hypothetical protein